MWGMLGEQTVAQTFLSYVVNHSLFEFTFINLLIEIDSWRVQHFERMPL